MQYFAEDAVFRDAHRQIYRSKAAIKHSAFSPLFHRTLGEVNFDWHRFCLRCAERQKRCKQDYFLHSTQSLFILVIAQ